MGDWSQLPMDLAETLEELMVLYIDKVRFRSLWNSPYFQKLPNHKLKQLPWLLHKHDHDKNKLNHNASHGIFNLTDSKVYNLDVPAAQGKMFVGSSHGWVATVENTSTSPAIYLINPLTTSRIRLPPRNKFPDVKNYRPNKPGNEYGLVTAFGDDIDYHDACLVNSYFLSKIVLSSTPSKNSCVAIALYGVQSFLAYCILNKKNRWISLHDQFAFADAIFYKGKLHALTTCGQLLVFESITANALSKQIATFQDDVSSTLYLVESSDGGLLMVMRDIYYPDTEKYDFTYYKTYCFNVYKHDPKNLEWVELTDLGEDIIFLGRNSTLSVSSRESLRVNFLDTKEIVYILQIT